MRRRACKCSYGGSETCPRGAYVGTAGLAATLSRILCRMPIPQPIDPRRLAAEIDASVAEFNRLVALACAHHIGVVAELMVQARAMVRIVLCWPCR